MAQNTQPSNYTHGYSNYTLANHQRRTAESEAAFLLPHIKKTDHVLDVGCGPGTITTGLARHACDGRTVGIDISAEVLQKARTLAADAGVPTEGPGAVVFEQGNILERLPYPDESFDVVFSAHTFGHLVPSPDMPLRALIEIKRVLRPGGVVATRDAAAQHFYPSSSDLDRLWTQNLARGINAGRENPEPSGTIMPALYRRAGFDADGGKVQVGGGANVFSGAETRQWLAWRAKGQLKEGDAMRQAWLNAGITEEEIQETVRAVEKWAETEDAWHGTLYCEMLGWK